MDYCKVLVMSCILLLLNPLIPRVYANDEADALLKLKDGFEENTVFQSWDSAFHPCTWFHVTCDDSRVQRIDLAEANLAGSLAPGAFANLTSLQYLELYNNNISGSIPNELGNLTELVSLDLSNNSLTGTIPPELGDLKKLKFIRLNDNQLTGRVPEGLASLPSLSRVDLTNNPNLCGWRTDKECPA